MVSHRDSDDSGVEFAWLGRGEPVDPSSVGVSVWPSPPHGYALRFLVIIGSTGFDRHAEFEGIGAAAYFTFADGLPGVVLADDIETGADVEGSLLRGRIKFKREAVEHNPNAFGAAGVVCSLTRIGTQRDNGAVLLVDYGDAPAWWFEAEGNP